MKSYKINSIINQRKGIKSQNQVVKDNKVFKERKRKISLIRVN